ncbi:D-2-hydroxyacid dehydrogenase [Brucepastera parasyntrophica]|uniref:D-2-hydroxyacid dehydrogenase n=1 Tax=Brucepastera parasyntrophica TaxID=2880008 RepID=UPI00210B4A8F|nr:D-2-hydroxyacid dehydrogenase [Brucepastera parasyntrophica]ULQ58988.1 D-2-hydroxyacid dehydrogenase [Brucepastera parasyntrophica]
MKIVILDGNALSPGDISWDGFRRFGEIEVYPRTAQEEAAERIGSAEAVIINKIKITEELLERCPSVKYVGVLATGYNVVDTAAAARHGVTVTNVPDYSTAAVSQHVFSLILEFTNSVQKHSDSVHNGDWVRCPDFCYWKYPLMELQGKTFGIFGFGNIGRSVARIAAAFGMNAICHTRDPKKITGSELPVESVSLEALFARSDVLTLHAPLTEETRYIINDSALAKMKPAAILINTARGPLVDEAAVRKALDSKKLAGYGCDVLSAEPMRSDNPLLNAPNCLITPHIAWAPLETRQRLMDIAVENLAAFIRGEPQNTVS